MGCMHSSQKQTLIAQRTKNTQQKYKQQPPPPPPVQQNTDNFYQGLQQFAIQAKIQRKSHGRKSKLPSDLSQTPTNKKNQSFVHQENIKINNHQQNFYHSQHQNQKNYSQESLGRKENNQNNHNTIQMKKNNNEEKQNLQKNKQKTVPIKNKSSQIKPAQSQIVTKQKTSQKLQLLPKKHSINQSDIPLPIVQQVSQQNIQSAVLRSSNRLKIPNSRHFQNTSIKQQNLSSIKKNFNQNNNTLRIK